MPKPKKEKNLQQRPNGSWQVRVVVGIRPDGTPDRMSRTFPTRDAARAFRDSLQAAVATGEGASWSPVLLRDWAERCMETTGATLQPYTRRGYTAVIRNHIAPARLGGMALRDIRPSHVQDWLVHLQPQNTRGTRPERLSPKTVKNVHGVLSWILGLAVDDGLIKNNPAQRVRLPQQHKPDRAMLTPDDSRRLLALASGSPDYPAYLLDAVTGLRRSELLGLCWDCVDLETGRYRIRRKLAIDEHGQLLLSDDTKTEDAQRDGVLDRRVVDVLRRHKAQQAQDRLAAGPLWSEHGLVFPDAFGRPCSPSAFSSRFYRLQQRAGIARPVGLHAFRHYVATQLIQGGVDLLAVASILGHSDPAYTRRAYEDLYDSSKKQAADVMASGLLD